MMRSASLSSVLVLSAILSSLAKICGARRLGWSDLILNFLDCAELYRAYLEHIGPTQQRNNLGMATKVAGYFPSSPMEVA